MIGIYAIKNKINGKVYIGKSKNIKRRFFQHKTNLKAKKRSGDTNRHLYNAVNKYGIDNFDFVVLSTIEFLDEKILADKELYFINMYKSTDRLYGYNLRLDSSTNCVVHEETICILKKQNKGTGNGNYGKKWSDEQKQKMSVIKQQQHAKGDIYTDDWKKKTSNAAKLLWSDLEKRKKMAEKVSIVKKKYNFEQYDAENNLIKIWGSVEDIVSQNPSYKWQNIYSVCNGYKKRIYGYVWKKVLKNE